MTLTAALKTGDKKLINEACQAYYDDPKIQHTIAELAKEYKLRYQETSDILQQALLLLLEKIPNSGFRHESKESTFVLGICRKLILTDRRKVERISFKDTLTDQDLASPALLSNHILLEELTEKEAERDETLYQLIENITEKCRLALVAFYFSKNSMAEIAPVIGLSLIHI